MDWGTAGMKAALAYHYFPVEFLGIGAEFSGGDLDGADRHWYTYNSKTRDRTKIMNLMLTTRVTVNPQNRVRFYFPAGAGWTIAEQELKINKGGLSFEKEATDVSFGWFAGLGAEWDVWDDVWSVGVEVRYHAFRYDTDMIAKDAPVVVQGMGHRRYSYLSCLFKISKRF